MVEEEERGGEDFGAPAEEERDGIVDSGRERVLGKGKRK